MDLSPIRPGSAVILQQVYHGSDYADLLALTLARNIAYCKQHSFDLELHYGNVIHEWKLEDGGWAKVALLYRSLMQGYQYAVWLDADSLIADPSVDLRAGCPPNGIGMVRHPHSNNALCTGNIYATNTEATRDLLLYWMQWYPGPAGGWHEQAAIILLADLPCFKDLIVAVDNRWNSCRVGGSHVDNAAVEGFHGEGCMAQRLALMKEYLATTATYSPKDEHG